MQDYKSLQSHSRDIDSDGDKCKADKDVLDNIRNAYDYAKESNDEYDKNVKMVFCDSLTDEDKNALEAGDRPTLTFSIIAPILKHQLKNITESIPESSVTATDIDEQPQNEDIAKGLTAKLQEVYDTNRYQDVVGENAELAGTGGKAIFKIQTEYCNSVTFDQKITIKSIPDPTLVFFDPCSKLMDKSDSEFVCEVSYISEDSFKRMYKNIDLDDIETYSKETAGVGVSWIRESDGRKVVAVMDYCYKHHNDCMLYLVKDGESEFVTKTKPKDESLIISERKTDDIDIKHIRVCGDTILEDATTLNFKHIPYVFFCSDSKIIDGKEIILPFSKPAIDAQRAKNISFNTMFFEMLNNSTGRFVVATESINDSLSDAIINPSIKKNIFYDSRGNEDGMPVQNPPPQYVPSSPIPEAGLQVFQSLDETINTILGSQYYSLDQTNMSGKALYNLADFMNASISTLMKNLIISTAQIGRVVLSAFPFLYEHHEVDISSSSNKDKVMIDYNEIEIEKFAIRVHRGANYALQQQVTVESMLEYSHASPAFAQWLNSEGIPLLLENTPLNGKNKIIESYKSFVEEAKMDSKNKPPSPEQIKAQADMMNAQNQQAQLQLRAKELQLKEQELVLKAHSATADSAIDLSKVQSDREQSKDKIRMDVYQQKSENQRELLRHYNNRGN